MERTYVRRVLGWAFLVSLAVSLAAVEQPTALGADMPVKKALSKRRGRLPARYAAVATEQQRDQILKIQDEYRPKIEALNAQLKALKKEQDDKITAVFTPEQKKQIEEAAAKAKSNVAKPSEAAPAAPPTEPKPAK